MSLITKEVKAADVDPDKPKTVWTREQEMLLAKWADKALCYRWLHDLSEKKFTRLNNIIQIPVIILSTATGAINVGVDSIFPTSMKQYANIGLGGISILTGIITTVGNFLRYAQNMEGHRVASIQWSKFHRNINAEINIHPDQRQDAVEFFTVCRAELDRLVEQSPSIPTDIINAFESRFRDVNISKPEVCNILEPTTIYKPHDGSDDWFKTPNDKDKKSGLKGLFSFAKKKKEDSTPKSNSETKPPKLNLTPNSDSKEDEETIVTFDNGSPNLNTATNNNSALHHSAILASLNK